MDKMSTELVLYEGHGHEKVRFWNSLPDDERRRRALEAARDHDEEALWDMLEAYLRTHGSAGNLISERTLKAYRAGLRRLLAAWKGVKLTAPGRDTGAVWVRELEDHGLKPATVGVYVASARKLYEALRWTGATKADPFLDVHPAKDKTEKWEKRQPYTEDELTALLACAEGPDRLLVLLCGHVGLRNFEACALKWADVNVSAGQLVVLLGKGRKKRTSVLSPTLKAVLEETPREGEYVLPWRSIWTAPRHMKLLCETARVEYRSVHSLRHTAGTWLVGEGEGSLEDAARQLGHSSIETTRIYIAWSDQSLRKALAKR